MIIKEVKGNAVNMYLNGEGHLIHGCNCYCNMGAGIAREIRDRIPGAFQVDANTLKGSRDKLGTCSVYIGEKGNIVFNAYTQYDFWTPGPRVDYDAIGNAFKQAVGLADAVKTGKPIITPLIGAGLADEIRELRGVCHCGKKATTVARIDANGKFVANGDQIEIGAEDKYVSLCRKHYLQLKNNPDTVEA